MQLFLFGECPKTGLPDWLTARERSPLEVLDLIANHGYVWIHPDHLDMAIDCYF